MSNIEPTQSSLVKRSTSIPDLGASSNSLTDVSDVDDSRFNCPYPGCTRSFAELWRLKVHYRAPPDARGSGIERGHGTELSACPRCASVLQPGKHHVGCIAPGRPTVRLNKRQKKGSCDSETPPGSALTQEPAASFEPTRWTPEIAAADAQQGAYYNHLLKSAAEASSVQISAIGVHEAQLRNPQQMQGSHQQLLLPVMSMSYIHPGSYQPTGAYISHQWDGNAASQVAEGCGSGSHSNLTGFGGLAWREK